MTWRELQIAIEAQGVTPATIIERLSWAGTGQPVEAKVLVAPYRHTPPTHTRVHPRQPVPTPAALHAPEALPLTPAEESAPTE